MAEPPAYMKAHLALEQNPLYVNIGISMLPHPFKTAEIAGHSPRGTRHIFVVVVEIEQTQQYKNKRIHPSIDSPNTNMTSIVELFPKCRKLAYDARQYVAQAQNNHHASVTSNNSTTELFLVLEELNRQLDCMEELVVRERPGSRQVWKHKIAELRQEAAVLYQEGNRTAEYLQLQQRGGNGGTLGPYNQDRDELLRRRRRRRGPADSSREDEESDLNNLADEGQSLQQSHWMLNDLIAQGEASLSGLVDQRQRLRGVGRVLADMSSRLGLTQSTMRIIERRDITDAYLVLAGIIVTCLVIYFVWF